MNNDVTNLEWATNKEQKIHAIKHNLCNQNIEGLRKANERRSIRIIYNGIEYPSVRAAHRITGVCESSIRKYGKEVV